MTNDKLQQKLDALTVDDLVREEIINAPIRDLLFMEILATGETPWAALMRKGWKHAIESPLEARLRAETASAGGGLDDED